MSPRGLAWYLVVLALSHTAVGLVARMPDDFYPADNPIRLPFPSSTLSAVSTTMPSIAARLVLSTLSSVISPPAPSINVDSSSSQLKRDGGRVEEPILGERLDDPQGIGRGYNKRRSSAYSTRKQKRSRKLSKRGGFREMVSPKADDASPNPVNPGGTSSQMLGAATQPNTGYGQTQQIAQAVGPQAQVPQQAQQAQQGSGKDSSFTNAAMGVGTGAIMAGPMMMPLPQSGGSNSQQPNSGNGPLLANQPVIQGPQPQYQQPSSPNSQNPQQYQQGAPPHQEGPMQQQNYAQQPYQNQNNPPANGNSITHGPNAQPNSDPIPQTQPVHSSAGTGINSGESYRPSTSELLTTGAVTMASSGGGSLLGSSAGSKPDPNALGTGAAGVGGAGLGSTGMPLTGGMPGSMSMDPLMSASGPPGLSGSPGGALTGGGGSSLPGDLSGSSSGAGNASTGLDGALPSATGDPTLTGTGGSASVSGSSDPLAAGAGDKTTGTTKPDSLAATGVGDTTGGSTKTDPLATGDTTTTGTTKADPVVAGASPLASASSLADPLADPLSAGAGTGAKSGTTKGDSVAPAAGDTTTATTKADSVAPAAGETTAGTPSNPMAASAADPLAVATGTTASGTTKMDTSAPTGINGPSNPKTPEDSGISADPSAPVKANNALDTVGAAPGIDSTKPAPIASDQPTKSDTSLDSPAQPSSSAKSQAAGVPLDGTGTSSGTDNSKHASSSLDTSTATGANMDSHASPSPATDPQTPGTPSNGAPNIPPKPLANSDAPAPSATLPVSPASGGSTTTAPASVSSSAVLQSPSKAGGSAPVTPASAGGAR